MPDSSMKKILQGVDEAAANNATLKAHFDKVRKTPRGPATRVAELKAAREQTLAEMKSGEAKKQGYDVQARLQGIDSEITRLSGD